MFWVYFVADRRHVTVHWQYCPHCFRGRHGQRPKLDRTAPKVLHAIDGGKSYRWIARDLGISTNTVAGIDKRHRANP